MLIIVTQLNKASTAKLQGIYRYLTFRYLTDSLSLLGSFVSWYLLVYLTRSKPTVNKVLIITIIKLRISSKITGTYFSLIKQITENLRCICRLHFIHFRCKCLNVPVVNRNWSFFFLEVPHKMIFCHYILVESIFHEDY